MTMNPLPISDDDLQAYADGQLDGDRRDAVEHALARDATVGLRIAAIRAQNAELRHAFDPWLAERVPPRLIAAAEGPAGHVWLSRSWPAFAAAATLVVGVAIGWFGRDMVLQRAGTPTTFAREAVLTHALYAADQRRPVEVWANEEAGLARWLTRRMGTQAHIPDLGPLGYTLVGGRLVAGNEKPTGLVMYENAEKQRVTLQWRITREKPDASGETAFRYLHEDGVGVFHWVDDDCAYALSGPFERQQLLGIARVVYGQLAAAPKVAPSAPPAAPAAPAPAAPAAKAPA